MELARKIRKAWSSTRLPAGAAMDSVQKSQTRAIPGTAMDARRPRGTSPLFEQLFLKVNPGRTRVALIATT